MSDDVRLSDGLSDGLSHSQLKKKRRAGTITASELARLRELDAAHQRGHRKRQAEPPKAVPDRPVDSGKGVRLNSAGQFMYEVTRDGVDSWVTEDELNEGERAELAAITARVERWRVGARTIFDGAEPTTPEDFEALEAKGLHDLAKFWKWRQKQPVIAQQTEPLTEAEQRAANIKVCADYFHLSVPEFIRQGTFRGQAELPAPEPPAIPAPAPAPRISEQQLREFTEFDNGMNLRLPDIDNSAENESATPVENTGWR